MQTINASVTKSNKKKRDKPLTHIDSLNAEIKDQAYKLPDAEGMYLHIYPTGAKYWRLKYRFMGKQKVFALGVFPEVSLAKARDKRTEARKLLSEGKDPAAVKKETVRQAVLNAENTFKALTKEWHEINKSKWTQNHGSKILRRFELHIFPYIGERPIKEIKPLELLEAIRKIENKGATELSHKLVQTCSSVFRYAILTGRAEYNPAGDLKGALKAHKEKHYPTISAKELPTFYKKLEEAKTSLLNKLAIKLLLLTFLRQGELRRAEWEHIDFVKKEWHVPAEHMKMREKHTIPLARQTIELLQEIHKITGDSKYIFPSQHPQKNSIMSENTIGSVIKKRMGYKGKMVGHGVRALASTILNENGFPSDVIERQLAHAERNKVRAAYNRAEYLDDRRKMMQWWADYLDRAANGGGNVIDGKFSTNS